jgi:hypothetical protein
MMVKLIGFLFCLLSCGVTNAQETEVDKTAGRIPAALKENAVAVYRLDKGSLTIVSASEYIFSVHQVVTILNEQGAHYLRHRLGFDKFYQVDDVSISLYDSDGVLKKKYGKKDFEVEAAYDGISLVTDDRVMDLYTPAPGYPCTMEVRYKIKANGYLELPDWTIQTHDAATEHFYYEVIVPEEIDIRHRTINMAAIPTIQSVEKKKKYTWEVRNVGVKKLESEGYEAAKYMPRVEVAPNVFSYDGYPGSFKTWKDFGSWNYQLYNDKKPFTPARISEIQALVSNITSPAEKIKLLYQYMQRNMRYVSIQLGIGGFKPFAVSFVDEKKYGDCKALTNYMRHLLTVAGIPSYPALINAGYNKLPADPSFPTDPFNHVILCVPIGKDTTWLECTSNTNLAGELGSFTENKKALLLTDQGGILVNTPKSYYGANKLTLHTLVNVTPNGGAEVSSKMEAIGEAASLLQYISQQNEDDQKEMLMRHLRFKQPETFKVASINDNKANLGVTMVYDKLYEFNAGNKFFFPLSVNKLSERLKMALRETDYVFKYPYTKRDTTVFQLPPNYILEAVPANKEMQSEYSSYQRSYTYDKAANKLSAFSLLVLKSQVIPALAYSKVARFFNDIADLEEETLILVQKQTVGF